MATLKNTSGTAFYWRIFRVDDPFRIAGVPGFGGNLPPMVEASFNTSFGNFLIEARASEFAFTALTPVSGPFANTDALVCDGRRITLAPTPQQGFADTGFRPSTRGFRFANSFPRNRPHNTVQWAGATRGVADAGMGLCGGMVFAALDYYATLTRPECDRPPTTGALFDHLCVRLMDTFATPDFLGRNLRYSNPMCPVVDRVQRMVVDEWPTIRQMLDRGTPVPIALVLVETADPFAMGDNHQVLIYAYQLVGPALTLRVYDPNCPLDDQVTITLNLANPQAVGAINCNAQPAPTKPVFTFWRLPWQRKTAPQASQSPAVALPARPALTAGGTGWVNGNGWIGLLRLGPMPANGPFNGTIYGDALVGQRNGNRVEFTRTVGQSGVQIWTGRIREDGSMAGTFIEQGLSRSYPWHAASALEVEGNGWPGWLTIDTMFGNGDFTGTIYGQPARGRWDHAARTLRFTRDGGPGYSQEWTGTCGFGLDFNGHFQERVNNTLKPDRYRWLASERTGSRKDQVSVVNARSSPVTAQFFAPDIPNRSVGLRQALTVPPGATAHIDMPLGVPLLLTHMIVVFGHGPERAAGYGDTLDVQPDGSVALS